jgi:hypothetical protein
MLQARSGTLAANGPSAVTTTYSSARGEGIVWAFDMTKSGPERSQQPLQCLNQSEQSLNQVRIKSLCCVFRSIRCHRPEHDKRATGSHLPIPFCWHNISYAIFGCAYENWTAHFAGRKYPSCPEFPKWFRLVQCPLTIPASNTHKTGKCLT